MSIDPQSEELFAEPRSTAGLKIFGAVLALAVTAVVFVGYTYIRNKHAREVAAMVPVESPAEPKGPAQALIVVDDAMLQGGKTMLGGTVKNTSGQKLGPLAVEMELRRRQDGVAEKKLVALSPTEIEPQQEARYSLELKGQEYSSARVTALKVNGTALLFTTAQGRKRPLERTESKTVTVDKHPPRKGEEFLNSADNPARIP